jgi:ribosomal protein L37AE/L43A
MPHFSDYKCTKCNRETLKQLLMAVKVQFTGLGAGAKVVRSRTIAWLCDECLEEDAYWNMPAYSSAPGMKSAPLERVRAAEAAGK